MANKALCHPERQAVSYGLCDRCRLKRDYLKRKPKIDAWRKNNSTKVRNYAKAKALPAMQLAYHLRTKFNLTVADYQKLEKAQGGKCAICRQFPTKRRLAIDHNHKNGQIRQLLCHSCNVGLGHFSEDQKILANAIEYLKLHERLDVIDVVAQAMGEPQ